MKSSIFTAVITAAVACAGFTGVAKAADAAACQSGPTVVELFTSQSCSSCIAAADNFEKLAARDDIVALAFHVDYWNNLATSQGKWVDPYSDAAFTERQRAYNRALRKRNTVYTPQLVIDGVAETVASSAPKVQKHLAFAETLGEKPCADSARSGEQLTFDIPATANGGEAYLIAFDPSATTEVEGGENAGRKFKDVNAVTGVMALGAVAPEGGTITADHNGACALIVQAPGQGRVVTAAYCP